MSFLVAPPPNEYIRKLLKCVVILYFPIITPLFSVPVAPFDFIQNEKLNPFSELITGALNMRIKSGSLAESDFFSEGWDRMVP